MLILIRVPPLPSRLTRRRRRTWPCRHARACRISQPESPATFYNRAFKCHRRVRCGTQRKHAERFRVRTLRPASREVSGCARSGNADPCPGPDRANPEQSKTLEWTSRVNRHPDTIFSSRFLQEQPRARPRANCCFLEDRIRPTHQKEVVELSGIEPLTPCLQSRCSPS